MKKEIVLVCAILASFVSFLDGSIVNVALPAISADLGGGFVTQQWVVDAYLLTLGMLMLLAGSLSDIYGRVRIMKIGLIWFGLSSLLCAMSTSSYHIIISRGLQGVGGALLVPSSLALIMSYYPRKEQSKVIGQWTAWTGVAFLVGPLLGGLLIKMYSWRLVFAINVLPIIITLFLLAKLKESKRVDNAVTLDIVGAVTGSVGLGSIVFALIEQSRLGWRSPFIAALAAIGVVLIAVFLRHEKNYKQPMMPLGFFGNRHFAVGNVATAFVYAGVSLATFLVVIFVQQVGGYSALASGALVLPISIIVTLLSSRFGALAGTYGPRLFMGMGPVLCGIGLLSMLGVSADVAITALLPGVILYGVGLSMTIAPITSTVLGAVDSKNSGIASAVNNAISRVAGLLAIAGISLIVQNKITLHSFQSSVVVTAALMIIGGVISLVGIPSGAGDSPDVDTL